MTKEKTEIVLFETENKKVALPVEVKEELSDVKRAVAKFATTTRHGMMEGKTQTHMTDFYSLDVIISVGYRIKSKHGVEFRRWENSVLKQYILQGYAVNQKRIQQLGDNCMR